MEIFSVMGGVRGAEIWAARAWTGGAGSRFSAWSTPGTVIDERGDGLPP
jgi:hypothetical protein